MTTIYRWILFHIFQELLRLFSIDEDALAKIYPSLHEFGKICNGSAFDNIPIRSVSLIFDFLQSNRIFYTFDINSDSHLNSNVFFYRFYLRSDYGQYAIIDDWANVL